MSDTRFITVGTLIDGSGNGLQRNVRLAVKDGIIVSIGSAGDLDLLQPAAVTDLSHCAVLPAMVDCSVFLSRSPSVDGRYQRQNASGDERQKSLLFERHAGYCLAQGVMGVAEGDNVAELLKAYTSTQVREHRLDIRMSGSFSPEEPQVTAGGRPDGDFLRICYSDDIAAEGGPCQLRSHEELVRILRQDRTGRKVVVASGEQAVSEALAAGCSAIEQGYGMGKTNLRKMADTGILWIPSVLRAKNGLDSSGSGGDVCCRFSQRYVAPGKPVPGAEALWKRILAEQLELLDLARQMGVSTAVGTGAGSIGILHGESVVEEIKLFLKAGYSLEEAIRSASATGAEFFGMDQLGELAVGKKATFLITRGTAQQLPRKLSFLEGMYLDGEPSPTYRKHPRAAG